MARFLNIYGPHGGRIWSGFLLLEIIWFEFRFRCVDEENHSEHPAGGFERQGDNSGAQSWPDFSTFMVSMMVRFFVDFRVFAFPLFGDMFCPADQGNHQQHPGDAFERLGHSSGAHSWQHFSTFLVRMVAGFLSCISRVNRVYGLGAETMVDGLPFSFAFRFVGERSGWVKVICHGICFCRFSDFLISSV